MAYHTKIIQKGKFGDSSKIKEEIEELIDAEEQGIKVMALVELSDLVGAIKGYLKNNYPDIKMEDLIKMADVTISSFEDGTRKWI